MQIYFTISRMRRAAAYGLVAFVLPGCSSLEPAKPALPTVYSARMPLLQGWFDGKSVLYISTDASDSDVAAKLGANYSPRLADALPSNTPGRPQVAPADNVYAVTNYAQGSIFASAPIPLGAKNSDASYSPLWRMIEVTWFAGVTPRLLKSEEDVLAAEAAGQLRVKRTPVVINCPILAHDLGGRIDWISVKSSTGRE